MDGSGFIANLTPRKSLMCLSISIPYGESFAERIFETSCGHNAHRKNNNPYKSGNKDDLRGKMETKNKIESIINNISI